MPQINIRYGTTKDSALIAELIENMVSEMAQFGGHAVNHSPEVWSLMAERVGANSAIYTVPSARRQGVARQLIQEVVKWGQQLNAVEVDLHVLVANPARRLYEQLGFQPLEISMVKKLSNDQIADE